MQWAYAILSSVVFPIIQYFSILSHKRHDLKEKILNIKRVFQVSLQLLCETFLILRRNELDIIKMCIGLHVKYPVFMSDFNRLAPELFF